MMKRGWWMRFRVLIVALVGLAPLLVATPGSAQERPDVNVQTFDPALQPNGIFTIERSKPLGHLEFGGTLVFDYLSEPLKAVGGDQETAVVDQQLAAHLVTGIGLFDRFELSLNLPVYLVNDVSWQGEDVGGFSAGDLGITARGQILSQEQAGLGLGASLKVTAPTGAGQMFVGRSSASVAPQVIVDRTFGDLLLAGNLGFRFLADETLSDLEMGDEFTYSLGAEYTVVDNVLRIGGELNGATPVGDFFGSADTSPLEFLLGAKVITNSGFAIMAGSGAGLSPGIGAPEFRAFLGISYPTSKGDSDGDGLLDSEDNCPDKAEDLDGFEDADGCPDPDNDQDGIPDDEDKCPDEAEDKNGYQDEDGCPDASNDTDGDGIVDMNDECVEKPEDMNNYQDEDGCPDAEADADGDGIPDAEDECREEAEDKDGFEDEDGCPDPDNDNDGIADAEDNCPDEAGVKAENGCPPKEKKVVREKEEIKILEKVYFEKDSANIKERSHDLLDQVSLLLRQNPDIKKVEIQGHTDDSGSASYNQELSQKRADAVMNYLVENGNVEQGRLVANGYGESEPLADNTSEENRGKNRRVEFKILEQEGVDGQQGEDGAGDEGSDADDSD